MTRTQLQLIHGSPSYPSLNRGPFVGLFRATSCEPFRRGCSMAGLIVKMPGFTVLVCLDVLVWFVKLANI